MAQGLQDAHRASSDGGIEERSVYHGNVEVGRSVRRIPFFNRSSFMDHEELTAAYLGADHAGS
jgi:hypothetical protein